MPVLRKTGVTTTRKPTLRTYTARVVERARERDAVAERHFDLTFQVGWVVGMLLLTQSHHLTQRQYHAPPVCPQSLQSSPDPHH